MATAILKISGLCVLLALASCGGQDQNEPKTGGGLRVSLTDAPACGFSSVHISLTGAAVHASASASPKDSGWTRLTLAQPIRIDLLTLNNGLLLELGHLPLAAGHYRQIRLELAEAGNSVTLIEGGEVALSRASLPKDGLALITDLDVSADTTTEVTLDMDACLSVVPRSDGSYTLRPIISTLPLANTGAISGQIPAGLKGAAIWAQTNGKLIKGARPDSKGYFTLTPLQAGSYDVVITADDQAATIVTDVPVSSGESTSLSPPDSPLDLSQSPHNEARGTATGNNQYPIIYAKQRLRNGRYLTIGITNATADTGTWQLRLPASEPKIAAYTAKQPLQFSNADISGSSYTIVATPLIGSSKAQAIDIGAPEAGSVDFSL